MLTESDQKLVQECSALKQQTREGLEWVKQNVSVEEGQPASVNTLRNALRKAAHLENAAKRRPCVAIFGQSQAGKSYLVSNLARLPDSASLEIVIPGEKEVDFIKAINPTGGKESTGLVTRFTIMENHLIGQAPIFLSLLSQTDLVKIIANGYFSDLIQRPYPVDLKKLQDLLARMKQKTSPSETDGMSEDEIYDLKEYLWENFSNEATVQTLKNIDFWENAAVIIPKLKSGERWQLFHILWGEVPVLTDIFNKLSEGLRALNFAKEARCGKEALIPKETPLDGATVSNSIIDIAVIQGLTGEDRLSPVQIHGTNGAGAMLPRSVISALTAEITMTVPKNTAEHPLRSFFKDVDILDFPGARSRVKIPVENLKTGSEDGNDNDVISVFLRGKIAYLFDRYCLNNEISSLVLCLPYEQPEVRTLPHLIANWIYRTHGDTPQERSGRQPSLFVVFTKFNIDLTGKTSDIAGDPSCHHIKWNARLEENFNKFYSTGMTQKWPSEWDTNGAFRNCFWLRDPQYSNHIFEGLDSDGQGTEHSVNANYKQKLEDMRNSYISHPWVKKHFHEPDKSWEEATTPGKSGMDYFVGHLIPTCSPEIKQKQLAYQLNVLKKDVCGHLRQFHKSRDLQEELDKARKKGQSVVEELSEIIERDTFGQLLDNFQANDDFVWKVYYDIENPAIKHSEMQDISKEGQPVIKKNMKKIRDSVGLAPKQTEHKIINSDFIDKAELFSISLIDRWRSYIEESYSSKKQTEKIGIKKDTCGLIIQELSKSIQRVHLVQHISNMVKGEIDNNSQQYDLISRLAKNELNRFVNTLGWNLVDYHKRPVVKQGKEECRIFSETETVIPDKKNICLDIEFPGEFFVIQWLIGIQETFKANVEFIYGTGIPNEAANRMLGMLLDRISCPIG